MRFTNRFTSACRAGRWRWPSWSGRTALRAVQPDQLRAGEARWFLSLVLVALLTVLIVGDPGRIDRDSTWLRVMTGTLIGVISLVNAIAVVRPVAPSPDVVRTGGDMAKPGSRPAQDLCLQPPQCQRWQNRPRLRQSGAEQRHQQCEKVRQRREVGVRVAVRRTTVLAVQPGHRDQLRARPASPNRGRGIHLIGDDRSRR